MSTITFCGINIQIINIIEDYNRHEITLMIYNYIYILDIG